MTLSVMTTIMNETRRKRGTCQTCSMYLSVNNQYIAAEINTDIHSIPCKSPQNSKLNSKQLTGAAGAAASSGRTQRQHISPASLRCI